MSKDVFSKQGSNTVDTWIQDVVQKIQDTNNSKFSTEFFDHEAYKKSNNYTVIDKFVIESGSTILEMTFSGKKIGLIVVSPTEKSSYSYGKSRWRDDSLQVTFVLSSTLNNAASDNDWVESDRWRATPKRGLNKTAAVIASRVRNITSFSDGMVKYVIARRKQINITKLMDLVDGVMDVQSNFNTAESLDSMIEVNKTFHVSNFSNLIDELGYQFNVIKPVRVNCLFGASDHGSFLKNIIDGVIALSPLAYIHIAGENMTFNMMDETYNKLNYDVVIKETYNNTGTDFNIVTSMKLIHKYVKEFNDTNECIKIGFDENNIVPNFNSYVADIATSTCKLVMVGPDMIVKHADDEQGVHITNMLTDEILRVGLPAPQFKFYIESRNKESYTIEDHEDILNKTSEFIKYISEVTNNFIH